MPDQAAHKAQLLQTLQQRWGGSPQDYQITGPVQSRLYSQIYKVSGPSLPCILAVKFCLRPETGRADDAIAAEQFHALQKVAGALQIPGYRISPPIARVEDTGLLLMEWIDAPALTQYMRWNISAARQCHALERAGRWLAHFHQAGPISTGTFDWQHKQSEARAMARNLLDDDVFESAVHTLLVTSVQLPKLQVQRSWVHGDSKTDNLLITDDCITGIDVALRDINAVEYDLAQFLNHLTLITHAPQHGLWLRACLPGQPKLETFGHAFLHGYRQQQPLVNPFSLAWLQLFQLLSLWHSTCHNNNVGLRQRILQRLFRNTTRRLQENLKQCHHRKTPNKFA